MGEQEEQRGKLAGARSDNTSRRQSIRQRVLEATSQRQDDGRRSPGHVVADWWARFWATSVWEKGVIIGGTALAGIAAIVAFFALSGGGSDQPILAEGPTPRVTRAPAVPTATATPSPTSTATPTRTPSPDPTPDDATATSEAPLNRRDCDEIAGTAYLSAAEREWFLDHCLGAQEPGETPAGPHPPPPVATPGHQPAPTPVPAPTASVHITSSQAIALAVDWLTAQMGSTYSISPASCNATQMGARWVVICQAQLRGCQGSACWTTLSACVFEQPTYVAPGDSC